MPVPEEEDRGHPGVTLVARTHLKRVGHLKHKDSGREHMIGTDTSIGHVTSVIAGYLYQPHWMNGISPEPNSSSATLYLYLSTSPRLFSHLGFLSQAVFVTIYRN